VTFFTLRLIQSEAFTLNSLIPNNSSHRKCNVPLMNFQKTQQELTRQPDIHFKGVSGLTVENETDDEAESGIAKG
jgi:hypothetical protein